MRAVTEHDHRGGRHLEPAPAAMRRRSGGAVVLALSVAVILSGCSSASAPADVVTPAASATSAAPPAASSSTAPSPAAPAPTALTEIPVVAATASPVRKPVAATRIRIGSQDIDSAVVPVGVRKDGLMALPDNPATAGWYRYGPDTRSARGSVVIAAHVDSLRYGLGPFVGLRDLQRDAEIRVTDDDGRTMVYEVVRVRHIGKARLPVESLFKRDGAPRLVLITCGGTFDTASRTYSDNVIVTAKVRAA